MTIKAPVKVKAPACPTEFNLATQKGMDDFRSFPNLTGSPDPYDYHCDLIRFLGTLDQPPLRWGNMPILMGRQQFNGDVCLFKKDRALYICCRRPQDLRPTISNPKVAEGTSEDPVVFLIDCKKRTPKNKNLRLIMLLNGDDDDENGIVAGCVGQDFPTISFHCLSQFFGDDMAKVARAFNRGALQVLDYTLDDTRALRKCDKEALKKARRKNRPELTVANIKPPKPGYTMINTYSTREAQWHRSGTVLLSDGKQCILMGQDDSTYFGVELPDACETIDAAMVMLVPPEAVGCQRQGEWFVKPVHSKEVPNKADCVLCFDLWKDGHCDSVYLPISDEDSNHHVIVTKDGRVGRDGTVYALAPELQHDEHGAIAPGEGWFTFIKNTAVRSFSEEGVD